jgi:hypothetical protein
MPFKERTIYAELLLLDDPLLTQCMRLLWQQLDPSFIGMSWYQSWSQLTAPLPVPSMCVCYADDGRVVVNTELNVASRVYAAKFSDRSWSCGRRRNGRWKIGGTSCSDAHGAKLPWTSRWGDIWSTTTWYFHDVVCCWVLPSMVIRPHFRRNVSPEAYRTLTPQDYIPYFKKICYTLARKYKKCWLAAHPEGVVCFLGVCFSILDKWFEQLRWHTALSVSAKTYPLIKLW